MQNKMNIDLSYILGTTLLHINKVSYGELLLIKRKMLSIEFVDEEMVIMQTDIKSYINVSKKTFILI